MAACGSQLTGLIELAIRLPIYSDLCLDPGRWQLMLAAYEEC